MLDVVLVENMKLASSLRAACTALSVAVVLLLAAWHRKNNYADVYRNWQQLFMYVLTLLMWNFVLQARGVTEQRSEETCKHSEADHSQCAQQRFARLRLTAVASHEAYDCDRQTFQQVCHLRTPLLTMSHVRLTITVAEFRIFWSHGK